MSGITSRHFNNMPIELQSAVINAHIPEKEKIDSGSLMFAESILLGIFTNVNPKIIFFKDETGCHCRVADKWIEEIREHINQRNATTNY